jgi:hypothetical protein
VGETISGSMVIYKNLTTELWNWGHCKFSPAAFLHSY